MEQQTPTTDVTSAPSDAGVIQTAASSTAQDAGISSQDVTTGLNQPDATQQEDPLANLPSLEELEQQKTQGIQYAEGLHRLRSAYEPLKSQFDDLNTKFQPLEPFVDRLGDPDQIEQTLKFRESLWKLSPDPETGEVMPDTSEFVEGLSQQAPETADDVFSRLFFGNTIDYSTGQKEWICPRIAGSDQRLSILAWHV